MARYVEVILRSGNGETVYQETKFKQNFETKDQQVSEQAPLFTAVAASVMKVMSEQK
jgi:hypothetical protein